MVLETKNMIPVFLAFSGWMFNVLHQRAVQQRTLRIERVNEQLSQLLGPLLACVTASKASYEAMVQQHSPDGTSAGFIQDAKERPDGQAGTAYRQVRACDIVFATMCYLFVLENFEFPFRFLFFQCFLFCLPAYFSQIICSGCAPSCNL